MLIHKIEQGTPEWHATKLGVISGTVAGSLMGTPVAQEGALYELVGERLSSDIDDSGNAAERGIELEPEARAYFEKVYKTKVETVGFTTREDCRWIGSSPDGLIHDMGKYRAAIEIKCLSARNHIQAIEENEIPKKYCWQVIQYFLVNDDLETLHFVLYNPLLTKIPFHVITISRGDVDADIEKLRAKELETVEKVNKIISKYI
jgi:putative phage-type endonuclease